MTSELEDVEDSPDQERKLKTSRSNYKCPWENCGKGFRRENEFDRHLFTHTGIKKYSCEVEGCKKSYIIGDHLRRHVRVSHEVIESEEIPCTAPDCGMIFTTRSNMVRHYRRKHENPRVFKCGDCDETFRRKDQVRRHRMKHTGQFPHNCDICGKGFINLKAFRNHTIVHRRIKCPQCDGEVNNWTELVAHRRREHRNAFKCPTCGKEFSTKHRLRGHEVIHRERGEQPSFTCEACGKDFTRKSNLVAHIRSVHEHQRHPCAVCDATLSTKRKLQLHMAKIHTDKPREAPRASQRPRRKRKDAGKPKISMASLLANVSVSSEIDKILMKNEGRCLEIDYTHMEYRSGSATDTESEKNLPISGVRLTLKGHI
ncbi:oocyte zinc finger protein XlCOF26 [Lutzomyia longipalpis]|uniref:oocyte zinc finger protein XlCOF26 n=1 Tax=Lutzomyia longipalpis TaxID=7200 RepID=UPI002483C177|nr:oocyte zinc finger protein XlCOF26 [Lutzomyia longipalpis]